MGFQQKSNSVAPTCRPGALEAGEPPLLPARTIGRPFSFPLRP